MSKNKAPSPPCHDTDVVKQPDVAKQPDVVNKQGFNPDTDVKPAEYPFVVAEGKAVTCLVGVLDSGKGIDASQLGGGAESLKALVKLGVVVKN